MLNRSFKGHQNCIEMKTLLTHFLPNYVKQAKFKIQIYQSIKAQSVLLKNKPHNYTIHRGYVCAQFIIHYVSPQWALLYLHSTVE